MEEAQELIDAKEHQEGKDALTGEMADLLYHSMVLLASEVKIDTFEQAVFMIVLSFFIWHILLKLS